MSAPSPRRMLALAGAVLAAGGVAAQDYAVPSGQPVNLQEVFYQEQDSAEVWLRARFIAPQIGTVYDFEQVADDFPYLCSEYALPLMAEQGRLADHVVVSLADRALEFGTSDPDATQYFEAYRVENGTCIWEAF